MSQIILTIISAMIILLGLIFTVLPFVPGPPVALIGLILYASVSHFHPVSGVWIGIFSILVLLSICLDIFAPALAARGYKASKMGMWGSVVGGLFGLMVLGPIGALLGPFVGAYIGEALAQANHEQAWRAAKAALIGILIGTIFKFIVSISIAGYFITALIRNL